VKELEKDMLEPTLLGPSSSWIVPVTLLALSFVMVTVVPPAFIPAFEVRVTVSLLESHG
jgi:hypothetical protein